MKYTLLFITAIFFSFTLAATPTPLTIRAKAKDAKFIGSSIGGARIIIREATSEKILAEGFTSGSTGNTEKIMKQPHHRHQKLSDEETAAFTTTLDLEKPTLLTIEGYGPWSFPEARIKVQTQVWVIPGKPVSGDGIVLEFPGLIVEIANPQPLESLSSANEISITANVVLMCGCPITPGGLWDASEYEVQAILETEGTEQIKVPLHITDKANTFKGSFLPTKAGSYQLTLYAYHSKSGNTGLAKTHFSVK